MKQITINHDKIIKKSDANVTAFIAVIHINLHFPTCQGHKKCERLGKQS